MEVHRDYLALSKFYKTTSASPKDRHIYHKFIVPIKIKSVSNKAQNLAMTTIAFFFFGSLNKDPRLLKRGRHRWCLGRETGDLLMTLLRYIYQLNEWVPF